MERVECAARPDWVARCEQVGLTYHAAWTPNGAVVPYWGEGACYRVTFSEASTLAAAATELYALGMSAAREVLADSRLMARYARLERLPAEAVGLLAGSWLSNGPELACRVRLAWDPSGSDAPVLLGFAADSPVGLAEQSAQQAWADDVCPDADQFAVLDDALTRTFAVHKQRIPRLHVAFPAADRTGEVISNAALMTDVAEAAGLEVVPTVLDAMRFDSQSGSWVGHDGSHVEWLYHPQPAGDLLRSAAGPGLCAHADAVGWLEPPWRALLSSRFQLPLLWAMYPGHPNVLPASAQAKSRAVTDPVMLDSVDGLPDAMPVFQQRAPYGVFGPGRPEFDVWIVHDEPAALGVVEWRRDDTGYQYRVFVPHVLA